MTYPTYNWKNPPVYSELIKTVCIQQSTVLLYSTGFDLLLETLLGKNDLHLMQLFALYKQSKVEGQGKDGPLYDKFQKNMIRKVMGILELVNHPKFPDFEFAVHLKLFGEYNRMDGWMTCDLTSFSTVFQSYQDDG